MKKKLIAMITVLTLCTVVVIGTTLAYFSTETATVNNTFTYTAGEDPKPGIEEPGWIPTPISPEKYFKKDPRVTFKNPDLAQEYYVAMVISGSAGTVGTELDTLKEILNYNATGGIAKVHGWNTSEYDFQIDEETGTVYAYFKAKLSASKTSSTAVFQGVKFVKDLTAFVNKTTAEGDLFNIDIQGYVVSSINDTNEDNADWGNSKTAMQAAFPDIFNANLKDATITAIYPPVPDAPVAPVVPEP